MENCNHCKFIKKTFGKVLKEKDSTNREYWLMTEIFVYLHGVDYCNNKEGWIRKDLLIDLVNYVRNGWLRLKIWNNKEFVDNWLKSINNS